MVVVEVSSGVRVRAPNHVTVEPAEPPVGAVRRATRVSMTDGTLAEALGADFSVDAEFLIVPQRDAGLRAHSEVAPQVEVEVGPEEGAVLLVEGESGIYGWRLPEETGGVPAVRRGIAQVLRFDLGAQTPMGLQRGDRAWWRHGVVAWLADRLTEPLRVFVLKFAARASIDLAVQWIEGELAPGLVDLSGDDLAQWVHRPGAVRAAARGPERVLLFVHGTFSSTRDCFGHLLRHDAGRKFLRRARLGYHRVIGFDHRTLAEGPDANAVALEEAIAAIGLPDRSVIDLVAHSRGGLVTRQFAMRLGQRAGGPTLGRMVHVACTNDGTQLADPENWATMVDLYTNIALAGARVAALLPGGAAVQPWMSFGIRTLGRFVQALSEVAISDAHVPGLAAMRPGSEFIRGLKAGNRGPERVFYVIADFESRFNPSIGITRGLAEWLADGVTDRLLGEANDLVVHTGSMTALEPRPARDQVLDFGRTGDVHHTVYFVSERVMAALGDWLLEDEAAQSPELSPTSSARVEAERPRGVGGASYGGEYRGGRRSSRGGYGRGLGDGSSGGFGGGSGHASSGHAGNADADRGDDGDGRDEDEDRDEWTSGGSFAGAAHSEDINVRPSPVVTRPAGREKDTSSGPTSGREPGWGEPTRNPGEVPADVTRAPTGVAPTPTLGVGREPGDSLASCHLAASMDSYPRVQEVTKVYITLSRGKITMVGHEAAATTLEPVAVDAQREVEVELIARRNCEVVDRGLKPLTRALKLLRMPKDDDEVIVSFDVLSERPGRAELLVEARQGIRVLASFSLAPLFRGKEEQILFEGTVSAVPAGAPDLKAAVLRIYELHGPTGTLTLRFDLASEALGLNLSETTTFRAGFSKELFVGQTYEKLEKAYNPTTKAYEQFLQRLRAEGEQMASDLLPERIREQLWACRDRLQAIQVLSEEPSIPWELLYLRDPAPEADDTGRFLCEWGLVRWLQNTAWPSRILGSGGRRLRYVVPDYADRRLHLAGALEERAMLARRFPASQEVPADSTAVGDFLQAEAEACDILHFACHGEALQRAVLSSDLLMTGSVEDGVRVRDPLTAEVVASRTRFTRASAGPLVFLNACQAGRTGAGMTGMSGFVTAFLRPRSQRGADAFVSPLWSVNDGLALTFADAFYEALLAGETLVEAARRAREASRDRREFTWLAYCVYGDPFARLA